MPIKIVDWSSVGLLVVQFVFSMGIGLATLGGSASILPIILLPAALASGVAIFQTLTGAVFDLQKHTVTFYSFYVRRELQLWEIKDANCEFGLRLSLPSALLSFFSGGKGSRAYMVNLSGDFGSRQIRFSDKRWRDSFLSVLRDVAPGCRITRWR